MKALLGFSGYVGSTLLRQRSFDACFRSTDIERAREGVFDEAVCAAAPAQKWIANRDPEGDRKAIDGLIANIDAMRCRRFTLISTVDVFVDPIGVDEESPADAAGLHAYGSNRRRLEQFISARFDQHLIVRLPGLVGPGLRKNAIFDLHNDNRLDAVDSRGVFQFYPMVNLAADLDRAWSLELDLVHLTAEPLSIADIASEAFGRTFDNPCSAEPARYELRSLHADRFGGAGAYQYSRRESMLAIRAYAQSEPRAAR
jgi:dTDP-4-dehydrorhamnose reductase